MDYILDYCKHRVVILALLAIFLPYGILLVPAWIFLIWLSHFVKMEKEEKTVNKREEHKWDIVDRIEQYDLVNPGGYTVMDDRCDFLAGENLVPWTCYFENDSSYGEISYVENNYTHERAELKHEYWHEDNLYAYWKTVYDKEKAQFQAIDQVLLRNGKVDIDARAFRGGKRFIKRDAEFLAKVLYDEGYVIDYVTACKIGLTLEQTVTD